MSGYKKKIQNHPKYALSLKWIKLISFTGFIQIIVQGIGFLSGILIIRLLPSNEYAYLTIANSMQGVMNILADPGVGIGLSAIGGKVWQDRDRFSQLINTALSLRQKFAVGSAIIITPVMIWMLISNNASITYTILITVAILIELHFYLKIAVLGNVPRFHSQITFIQKIDLTTALSRFTLLSIASLTRINVVVAAFTSTMTSGLQSFLLDKKASREIDTKAEISKEYKQDIFKLVKHLLPSAIFFSLQGQLNVFLISIFGNTQNIAEIGALGRLAVLFSVLNSIMSSIILPGFARCQSMVVLRRRYFQIVLSFTGFGIILLALTLMFPNQILWVLGSKYSHLQQELIWMVATTILANLGGVMWSLCSAKGWIENVWVEIPIRIFLQILLLAILNISTVKGVLIFSLISNIPQIIISAFLAVRGLRNTNVI